MRTRLAAALAAFALLVLAFAAGPAASVAPAAVDVGSATCTTSSSGYCTVPHSLGSVPVSVLATPKAPISGTAASQIAADSFTATNFRVRVRQPSGSAFVGSVTFSYAAYAGAAPTSSSTSTTGTTTTSSTTTTPPPTTSSSTTSTTSSTTTSPAGQWPNPGNTGVPAGWTPASTRTTDLRVTTAGAVVEDVRIVGADLIVDAANVTIRRVEIQGGRIVNDPGSTCRNGLVIEDTSLIRAPGQSTSGASPAIQAGGYTARRVKIDGLPEGFRVGGKSVGCTAVTVQDSFARVRYPDTCGDWHGDTLQGYDGPALTVRNVTLDFIESGSCGGTAPFFVPSGQGNTSVDIDRLLVKGGGFSFRLGMPGPVSGLRIVDGEWGYGPIDVKCSVVTGWEAQIVTVGADYQPTTVRAQPCNTETGG